MWQRNKPPTHICTKCRSTSRPKTVMPGSPPIELLLYMFFILPGMLYSAWRHKARRADRCAACASDAMIPLDTPEGERLFTALEVRV